MLAGRKLVHAYIDFFRFSFSAQDLMYKDPARWAMPFQTYVTLTMLQTHTALTDKRVKLMERSLFSARYGN